ncbi:uncharacterized protein LOC122068302 [Macadamia integrifolia]|uniref:uncharacterized protein LOC122068302 n=1 Tax=Macadamia integrifolia TaxID=60698 RepID=UPI001C5005B8|nr:uncharacterized protein LOC122068302 [Macadamia integrifolia]XP_042488114.1 uncharacterized protein LOC122068302 [Macadamia integrifolia]XP_042488115.1 uncharacterized protein LOC122068302 [Macadamia integrifolia]
MASSSSSSKLAWLWCFEALADFKPVDRTLLRDLTSIVPKLSNQLSETARERVALICLEQWLSVNSASDEGVASLTSGSGLEAIDGVAERRSCVEVLHFVLNKAKMSEMLKEEVHQFILHKRESLPGCALRQLKDAIQDGTHPISTAMWKRSGLAKGNQNWSIIHAGKGDPTEPARIHDTADYEIQAPTEKLVHPLSQKNGKELLQEGQEWNKSGLDQENQNKSITPTDGSPSFQPVMIHNNTGDNRIQAPQEKLVYIVSGGNGKELLQGQPPGGNTESAQWGMENEKPVERHLCLDDDHHVNGSHMSCLKDWGYLRSDLKLETVTHGTGNEILKGNPSDSGMKSTKRERSGLAKESQLNCLGKSRILVENIDHLADVKIANYVQTQSIVHKHEQVDPPGRIMSLPENFILTNETQIQGLEGAEICGDGTDFLPLKKSKNGNSDCEIQHYMSCNDKVSLTSSPVVSQRNNSDNAEDNKEISESQPNGSNKNVSVETEDRDKGRGERQASSKNGGHSNVTLSLKLTDTEFIAAEKHRFLNSRSTYDYDSQATSYQKAQRICCKCGRGGQLLICSVNCCPLVVHNSCLGSPGGFDDKGNFQCPFCSYERAITACLDLKKKLALARKCYATFICAKSSSTSQEPQSRKTTDVGLPDKNHDKREHKEIISNHSMQVMEHQKDADDVGRLPQGLLSGTEPETSIGSERNDIVLIGENPKPVVVHQIKGSKEDQQPKGPPNVCCNYDFPLREESTFPITETPSASLAMERGKENMPDQPHPISGEEEEKKQEFACKEDISANLPCTKRTISLSHEPARHGNLNPVLQQQIVNPVSEPSSQPIFTAKETTENESDYDDISSDNSRRSQRPAIRRSFPVLSGRRRKVPWTNEEEEILVEGMRRFSSTDYKNVPWKMILEFGSHVFHKNRNAVDLKDKWRNICTKGDPRAR